MNNFHIIINHFYTKPLIEFVENNFEKSEHKFCVIGRWSKKEVTSNMIKIYKFSSFRISLILKFIIDLNRAKVIIIHGYFSYALSLILFIQPWLHKKCIWAIWGGDLYYDREFKGMKFRVWEYLKSRVLKNFKFFTSSDKEVFDFAKKTYNTNAHYMEGAYMSPMNFKLLDKYTHEEKQEDRLNILIGNSADPSNNHIEVLKLLSKFKDENLTIYCSLAYGKKDYKQQIIESGKKIFDKKIKFFTEILSEEEYTKSVLQNINIAIMNHDRPQAMGNIKALLYLGKKIYAKSNSMLGSFRRNGIEMYEVSSINQISYEEFIHYDINIAKRNRENLLKILDEGYIASLWRKMFYSEANN